MDPGFLKMVKGLPTHRVADLDAFDAVKIKHDTKRVVAAWHPNINHFPAHPALAARQIRGGPAVLQFNLFPKQIGRLNGLAHMASQMVFEERLGRI